MAIFGSICLYPRGGIAYIDALFLSSGAATQSGLNTVNLNTLNTWQQMVLFFIPMMCNPISINTFVVFLRLYWFEKRFQHIADEAKRNRRSIAKSMSKSKAERDIGREERGVQGRSIVVMHETTRPNGMTNDGDVPHDLTKHLNNAISPGDSDGTDPAANKDTPDDSEESTRPKLQSHQTQIRFADQVKPNRSRTSDDIVPTPIHRNPEEHIAFLERQRNPDDNAVLRIPGPRDADAGVEPEMVDESDVHQTLSRRLSMFSSRRDSEELTRKNSDDNAFGGAGRRRNITITEPTRPSTVEHVSEDGQGERNRFGSVLRLRKPKANGEKAEEQRPLRSRRSTLNSIKRTFTQSNDEAMPYLSWEPTIGRNSAFVDLTESQREELGGIEYRALKSLALILTVYFWGFMCLGFIGLIPWILQSKTYGPVVTAIGQGRTWWAFFTASSAFTDLGFTLTPDSMSSFQTAVWPLLLLSFLIIIGNTGFPIMLRFIIWVTSLYVPRDSGIWEELRFLLDHPRRCFTLLFPSRATWLLFLILALLNGLDLIFFIILDVSLIWMCFLCISSSLLTPS
jgi:potassium uptake Trk family protein